MSEETPTPPSRRDVIRQFIPNSPLVAHLGIVLRELEPDRAVLALPFHPALATMGDVVHGGAIAALVDTAGMAATWADDAPAGALAGSTITFHVDFVAPARGCDLEATATVVRRGRSICFSDVTVTDPGGEVVARGSVVQRFG